MAIKNKNRKKRASAAAAAASSSAVVSSSAAPPAMAPPPAHPLQLPPLPPGVYFSPTRDESVGILNRWIAGEPLHETLGFVFVEDVYGSSPEELRRRYPPACVRGRKHSWWFLCDTRFQSSKKPPAPGARRRADRRVATGGYWRLEQSRKDIPVAGGVKNCFGFYLGPGGKRAKTPWLVEEFTSARDDGAGKGGQPALYRLYVTPRATNDVVREIFGEDGIEWAGGVKRPMRVEVPAQLFDAVAGLLPHGRVRYRAPAQQHPPPTPPALLDYEPQAQGHFFSGAGLLPGQYDYEQQFWGVAPPPEGVLLGQYDYEQQQFWGLPPPQPPPLASPGAPGEIPEGDLGQYEEQFFSEDAQPPPPQPPPASPGPCPEIPAGEFVRYGDERHDDQLLSPPASPGLLLENLADNMSVSWDELSQLFEKNQAEAEKPAEEEEAEKGQEFDSLVNIVDDFERFSQND